MVKDKCFQQVVNNDDGVHNGSSQVACPVSCMQSHQVDYRTQDEDDRAITKEVWIWRDSKAVKKDMVHPEQSAGVHGKAKGCTKDTHHLGSLLGVPD